MISGLSVINIELSSRCNKNCWMCGRRQEGFHQDFGDMDKELAIEIAKQIPKGTLVQFHNNGEPLLYPHLYEVLTKYKHCIRHFDTNGKLLVERASDIIDNLDVVTISVIENDEEQDSQYDTVRKFLEIKGDKKPKLVYRLLGDTGKLDSLKPSPVFSQYSVAVRQASIEIQQRTRVERWYTLPGLVAKRILHSPKGSYEYEKTVTIPEHGICLDLLSHLVIDRFGNVFPCVRFNPERYNLLGNIKFLTLDQMWNGEIRQTLIREHTKFNRKCSDLCKFCDFYGVPRG
jgi:radical SAM protein with 4Fe4S-binding SPASM domain